MSSMATPLPPMWRPTSEAELKEALENGAFTESHYRDAKKAERKPAKLAADMASFAIDGGLLVVGVAEPEQGRFELAPLENTDQLCESFESTALTKCEPPLSVAVDTIPSEEHEGHVYLLVEIPASATAPHQVEGVYYGRGDKQKRRLSDNEVERYVLARDASMSAVRRMLDEVLDNDPRPDELFGHLHIVARPHTPRHRMFMGWTHGERWSGQLHDLVRNVSTSVPGSDKFQPMRCIHEFRTAGGAGVSRLPREYFNDPTREADELRVAVLEGGGAWWYCCSAAAEAKGHGVTRRIVNDAMVAHHVRVFLELLNGLSREVSYGGGWDVGVAVTGIDQAVAVSRLRWFEDAADVREAHTYDRGNYEATVRASRLELEKSPQVLAEILIGPLMRSMEAHPSVLARLENQS